MSNLNDRLREVEAELARQDRDADSLFATLQQHVAAEAHFELTEDLWNELEEAFESAASLHPAPPPIIGARC